MQHPGDVVAVIAAKDETACIAGTVNGAARLLGVDLVVVVDDGSSDGTGAAAASAGAHIVRHDRNRGKAAAMESGADVVHLLDESEQRDLPRHVLFLDADLGDSAAAAAPLIEPVRAGTADMTIGLLPADRARGGGHGFVVRLSREGIRRATGWTATQPLSGQRCVTRQALRAARPLARGFGVETALTIDLLQHGMRIREVETALAHRATGSGWRGQLHRGRQFLDVARALLRKEFAPAVHRIRPPHSHAPAPGGRDIR